MIRKILIGAACVLLALIALIIVEFATGNMTAEVKIDLPPAEAAMGPSPPPAR